MKTTNSKPPAIAQVEEQPIYEAYTLCRVQGEYIFRTVTIQGNKVLETKDSPPYLLVEADNKLRIALGQLRRSVREDKGKNQL